ncbi:hypothetical protein [Luteitalea sp.]
MTETSRLSTTAAALEQALGTLADALAHVREDGLAASEAVLAERTLAFQAAVADAGPRGDVLAPDRVRAITAALARCRRLGCSLSLLIGAPASSSDVPRGYTPVGQPLSSGDAGIFLTARG